MNTYQVIQQELLKWYWKHKRDLPWRKDKDPYKIWVSEIMLQQTRVSTVIPYYKRFMERFPTLQSLANASDEEVVKHWEGLGYYSRARNLHTAVKEVAAEYGGVIPPDKEKVSRLKGVGSYTAGAILSIAYNLKVPAVDGNVMRVFSRLFAIADDISKVRTKRKMEKIAEELIPEESVGDFNQALMELGATICIPRSPRCLFCPIQSVCKAYQTGTEQELPRKKQAKPPKILNKAFACIMVEGKFFVVRRPDGGLLGGMWSLPTWEVDSQEDAVTKIKESLHQRGWWIRTLKKVDTFSHIFSHQHWNISLFHVALGERERKEKDSQAEEKWITHEEIVNLTFPNVYHKAFKRINECNE